MNRYEPNITSSGQSPGRLGKSSANIRLRTKLLGELFLGVSELFKQQGINFAPIKGIALSNIRPERSFGDIDLFVYPYDVRRCLDILKAEGFGSTSFSLTESQFAWELKTQHAFEFVSPDSGLELDLHWRTSQLQYGLRDFSHIIWGNLEKDKLCGQTVCVPRRELQALIAISQAVKDQEFSTNLGGDLDALFSSPGFDWNWLRNNVFEFKLERAFFTSLKFLEEFRSNSSISANSRFGTIPESLIKELRTFKPATVIWKELQLKESLSAKKNFLLDLRLRDSALERVRYFFMRLFVPHDKDWNWVLPKSLFPLYFVIKPLRTLVSGILSLKGNA